MKKVIVTISAVFIAISSLVAGCTGKVYSCDNFIDDLRASGASVEERGGGRVQPFPDNVKNQIMVNGEYVYVFEFDNEAQTDEQAALIFPDGTGIDGGGETGTGRTISWEFDGNHFYKKGRVIAYYKDYEHISSSADISTHNLLESILGSQFAGAEGLN